MRVLVVAEAGVNHNGEISLAKQLIDSAAEAGADLVKFQTFNAERLATAHAPRAEYQMQNGPEHKSQLEMLRRLELSSEMHEILIKHCQLRKVGFFSSAFDIPSLDYLLSLGLNLFKVPSGEITNLPYLRHLGTFHKPVILSTGMATFDEVEEALRIIEAAGTPRTMQTVLHCNTEYPTPSKDVNLYAMCTLRDKLRVSVGYSDHTSGIEIPIAAVALGAKIIEKHITIDRTLPGPDHSASIEPDEFSRMVRAIRYVEEALGDGVKIPSASERKNIMIVRKSLVASRPIRAGERFSADNVTTKRPGTGVSPMRWDEIIGKVAVRNYEIDDFIESCEKSV